MDRWQELARALAETYDSPEYRAEAGHGLPGSEIARKMVVSIQTDFRAGGKSDWFRYNPWLRRTVRGTFGFSTTKEWRAAWAAAGECSTYGLQ